MKAITNMSFSKDLTLFITASSDRSANLYDTASYEKLATFKSVAAVNAASISPKAPHICLGGGQEARDVTTTSSRSGNFESKFYHIYFEEELGSVGGHFGPINSLDFNPDGKSFASGSEDGYIRIHHFDAEYFEHVEKEEQELASLAEHQPAESTASQLSAQ